MDPNQQLWLTRAGYVALGFLLGLLVTTFMWKPVGDCLPAGTSSNVVVGIDAPAMPA